jgi:hypothetical protein
MKLEILARFSKNSQMSYLMKVRLVESELFMRTDRHDEACIRFSQTCERT